MGWSRNYTQSEGGGPFSPDAPHPYRTHGGDNRTPTGAEAVLIDFAAIVAAFPKVATITINIPKRGNLTIYWGTETQTAPAALAAAGHPPYRGQCFLYFQQLYFGRDKTSAPNVEVVLKRQPQTGELLAVESELDGDTVSADTMPA